VLALFYALAVCLIASAIWSAGGGWLAMAGLIAFAGQLARQVSRLAIDDAAMCLKLFKSNRDAGLLLFGGLLLDALHRSGMI
jgi:4-hydroxybenzoate polyprenyltransferase